MYKTIFKTIIFPMMEIKMGTNQLKCLQILEKTQWFNRTQLEQLQYKRLEAVLRHAYENVPFYHSRFNEAGIKPEDIKNSEQIAKLPKLTKEDIRKNLPRMIARNIPRRRLEHSATGGSTGEPLKFFKDKRTISWASAAVIRNYRWAGLDLGDRCVLLWGSPFDVSVSEVLSGRLKTILERGKTLSSSEMSEQTMDQYIKTIRKIKPKVIKGYASALALFAHHLKKRGISDINPNSIISTAEKLFEDDRKDIEIQFNCEVFDTYGSREIALMAGECQEHSGYHISAETVLLEFVKGNEAVSEGELGQILVTDLQNYGMPLIRYSIGDGGRPSTEECSCGRGLPLMKSIEGRITDFIHTNDGKLISGPGLTLIFSDLNIKRYQILQRRMDQILVRIVRDLNYSDEDDTKIVSRMKKLVGENTNVVVEHLDSIPKLPRSGKHLFIISEILHD